jgi:hypothetical protein
MILARGRICLLVKKPIVAVVLSTLLLLTFGLGIADRANAFMETLPYIYIREDGSIEPSTAHLRRNGNIYTLTSDIVEHTLLIDCDNIVVDGNGYSLKGRCVGGPLSDCAIRFGLANYTVVSRKNVTIKNFNIDYFPDGIEASNLSEGTIMGNTINCARGISISGSRNQITGNTLMGAVQDYFYGISISGSYNRVEGNNISICRWGIVFVGEHNTASNNVLVGTKVPIDTERASDTILENNTLPVASPSPSPEPSSTPEPTSTPYNEPTGQGLILGVLAIVVVCAFGLVLLYRIKRK